MENQKRRNNSNRNRNRNEQRNARPSRPARVKVDRDTEVVVMNNTFGRFIHNNPRLSMIIDLDRFGDEEYLTVADLRTIANTNKKIFENFELIILEVPDGQNTVEEVVNFLGLGKHYESYFKAVGSNGNASLKDFVLRSDEEQFERTLNSMEKGLRNKVVDLSVKLFKMKQLKDYGKMQVIQEITGNEDLFDDAKGSEIDLEIN